MNEESSSDAADTMPNCLRMTTIGIAARPKSKAPCPRPRDSFFASGTSKNLVWENTIKGCTPIISNSLCRFTKILSNSARKAWSRAKQRRPRAPAAKHRLFRARARPDGNNAQSILRFYADTPAHTCDIGQKDNVPAHVCRCPKFPSDIRLYVQSHPGLKPATADHTCHKTLRQNANHATNNQGDPRLCWKTPGNGPG